MSAKKIVQGIEVRKIPFEFPPNFQPHWHPDDPAFSQLSNTMKLPLSPAGMLPT